MGIEGVTETRARRTDDLDDRPPAAPARKEAKAAEPPPWAHDFSGILGVAHASTAPIFVQVSSPGPSGAVEDAGTRAKLLAVVHPERSFSELKPLTVEIFRLKAESKVKREPDVASALKMRLCMLQSQWVAMATAAGVRQPTSRLDPFSSKPDEIARALMWSEAGGAIPTSELTVDGGKAYSRSIREAVTLNVRGFDAVMDLHRGQPEEQKALLHRELKRLGDAAPAPPADTIESLSSRRQQIVSKRKSEEVQQDLAAADAGRKLLYMGLDGFVGTAQSVERYERNEALKASVSDTTLGSILASYLGGGDVEKMRVLGQLGSNTEGVAGGAGVVIQAGRRAEEPKPGTVVANTSPSAARKPTASAAGAPPSPAKTLTVGPRPEASSVRQITVPSGAPIRGAQVGRVEPFNPVGAKLRTTSMLPRYAGEDVPGNRIWHKQTVTYCRTSAERGRFKLEARTVEINGKPEVRIFDAQGRLFDTRSAATWDGTGKAMFVMDANGELFASTYQEAGVFHHSSLAGGQPVAAAGELTVIDGKLVALSNRSGHYQPDESLTEQAITSLRSKGVDMRGVTVGSEATKTTRVLR